MAWVVTLQITDCASSSTYLSYANINDGYVSHTADVNGQFIAIVDDYYYAYVVSIGKTGYSARSFTLTREQHGSIQNVCLNAYVPPIDTPGSTDSGW